MPNINKAYREDLSEQLVLSAQAVAAVEEGGDAAALHAAQEALWGDVVLALEETDDDAIALAMTELAELGADQALDILQYLAETAAETMCAEGPNASETSTTVLFSIPVMVAYNQPLSHPRPFLGRGAEMEALEDRLEAVFGEGHGTVTVSDYLFHPAELHGLNYSDVAMLTRLAHNAIGGRTRLATLNRAVNGWPREEQVVGSNGGFVLRYLIGTYHEDANEGGADQLQSPGADYESWLDLADGLVSELVRRKFPDAKGASVGMPLPFFHGLRTGTQAFADSCLAADVGGVLAEHALEPDDVAACLSVNLAEGNEDVYISVRLLERDTGALLMEHLRELDWVGPGGSIEAQVEHVCEILEDLRIGEVYLRSGD